MAEDNGTRVNPPYLGYGTFKNYIGELAATTIPPRIDPTMMVGKSGGTKAALRVALNFFGLTNADLSVTETLRTLVRNHGTDAWAEHLRLLIERAYGPIVSDVPLLDGTTGQLTEAFRENTTLASSTTRAKAIGFYLQAAKDAGIELSTHFRIPRATTTANGRKKKVVSETGAGGGSTNNGVDPSESLSKQVLDKLPDFDGSWPEEVQKKWFEALDHVVGALKSDG